MATKSKKPAAEAATLDETTAAGATAAPSASYGYDGFADLGRENLAAVMQANAAFSEGLEALSKEVMGYTRASFESASQAALAFLGAKTLEDVVELNGEFAKQNLEVLLARSAKLSEMSLKIANETLAPLGGRVEATLAKLTKPLAA